MNKWRTLADIRREYGELTLLETEAADDPIVQFTNWFEQVLQTEMSDPTAMVLSTVDEKGLPDSRVVLLKGVEDGAFIFYTNYGSAKAMQLMHTPYAALNFYWPQMARQVRIRGRVKKVSAEQSDRYFATRPSGSQLSAIVSPQSQALRDRKELEEAFNDLIANTQQQSILRPENWGGYQVLPEEVEFWQGRDNRLHDRLEYFNQDGRWIRRRLAP